MNEMVLYYKMILATLQCAPCADTEWSKTVYWLAHP